MPVEAGATRVPENRETGLLCGAPFVSVMKATHLRNGHDGSVGWRRDQSRDRRIRFARRRQTAKSERFVRTVRSECLDWPSVDSHKRPLMDT